MKDYRAYYLALYGSHECEVCGTVPSKASALDIHHRYTHETSAAWNLVALCRSCHSRSDPSRNGHPTHPKHKQLAADYRGISG